MTDEASQRPWRLEDSDTIRDADGVVVVSALNPCNRATRRLIVAAVNERDRIRDVIRDIGNTAKHALGYLHAVAPREAFLNIAPSDLRNIVEIARAAIGEDEK